MCSLPSPKSVAPRSPIRPRSYQALRRSHRPNVRDHDQLKLPDARRKPILHAGIRPSPSSGPLSTGSPLSGLDQPPVRLGLCRYCSRSSGNCLGTISDRRTSNRVLPAANQSGKPSHSAWFPRLASTDPFRELLFPDAPGSERTLDFDGSPTTLLESSLHAELGVDAVYAARSSNRPLVDGEGRRPLHFPVGGLAGIPAHRVWRERGTSSPSMDFFSTDSSLSPCFFSPTNGSVWYRLHGRLFRLPGVHLFITPLSTCRRNPMASINSIHCNSFHTSLSFLSWHRCPC